MAYPNSTVPFEKMLMKFVTEEDPMQAMLKWLCERLMEAEVDAKLGAEKSERSTERQGYRSGYRVRRFDTRMGTLYLMVPKLRNGGYIPFFVEGKKRSELALMNVIQEAYVNGVSTRKIEKLTKSLGIDSMSRSQVSSIAKELNEQVEAFRNRSLDKVYPVLWVDALYEKIRDDRRVKNMAVLIVTGIDLEGKRDILAVEPMPEESTATYTSLFEKLKSRGLEKVWLVVSDAHKGLVKAVQESFIGCSWQRCKVHFMRNILAHISGRDKQAFANKLKQIWLQPDYSSAKKYANSLMDEFEAKYPEAIKTLEEGLEDSLQFFSFAEIDSRKIASTNLLERLNREVRRRTRVVGIFPSMDSYIRLVTSYLIEYSEDWCSGRSYINPKIITSIEQERSKAA
ncbi:transposase [Desulfitobacterium dichloroeliminans LMG P-21439]|uniref:Mutator family transposase n=7 Tax=Desulfitobacterium TaxID=36853 RepID=L0F7H2_DESDL|nr:MULTISPECIES: IS256-like element ISDha1 family transposase [Desulfitobacterium]CAG70350.1 putative transposase [Desulfitobacterium hafniense TCE1]AGA68908.1 transposase [Desulfitobacterium dichloroeliminans LMG P-21439]AGA68917.1 transposase [Desulfitobacterium dichloroeliminans LMG P-21439]TWH56166.1 transposase-like protein [Desulfitobacterium sp. LBE]TWH58063.1 transposase-like protein [Desulfitobacterium sp. LBE]